jgi:hypothetical protein
MVVSSCLILRMGWRRRMVWVGVWVWVWVGVWVLATTTL